MSSLCMLWYTPVVDVFAEAKRRNLDMSLSTNQAVAGCQVFMD